MSALAAAALAVAAGVAGVVGMAVADVVSRELGARWDKLPEAVLRLAALRLPESLRAKLRDEWTAELAEILRGREALPATRLWVGTRYAFGLLRSSGAIGRALSPAPLTDPLTDPLAALLSRRSYSATDQDMLRRAYLLAADWHRDDRRRSGDPYVTHSLAVARILADIGMDPACVCAGLLHDLPAKSGFPFDRLDTEFGDDVAAIIRDVTALDTLPGPEALAALETTGRRALALKLADRLHNMRTIDFMRTETQQRKSRETLAYLVPLAARLGFDGIQRELAEIAVSVLVRTSAF